MDAQAAITDLTNGNVAAFLAALPIRQSFTARVHRDDAEANAAGFAAVPPGFADAPLITWHVAGSTVIRQIHSAAENIGLTPGHLDVHGHASDDDAEACAYALAFDTVAPGVPVTDINGDRVEGPVAATGMEAMIAMLNAAINNGGPDDAPTSYSV